MGEEITPQIKPPIETLPPIGSKSVIIILIVALIGMFSFQINVTVGDKIEEAHQQGVEEGTQGEKDRIQKEISKELDGFGFYRFSMEVQDGTSTDTKEVSRILIPPSNCQRFLNQ